MSPTDRRRILVLGVNLQHHYSSGGEIEEIGLGGPAVPPVLYAMTVSGHDSVIIGAARVDYSEGGEMTKKRWFEMQVSLFFFFSFQLLRPCATHTSASLLMIAW